MQTQGALQHGELTERILRSFFDVYNAPGWGFLESVYQAALFEKLRKSGMRVEREVPIRVIFEGTNVGRFYADIVVEDVVILKIKAARRIVEEHKAQLIHYLRATAMEVGLILNFGTNPEFERRVYANALKPSAERR